MQGVELVVLQVLRIGVDLARLYKHLAIGRQSHLMDYRNHVVATHLGQVTVRLPRFRCPGCDAIEAGVGWPSQCRSTPEFDQLQAHFSALMP